MKEKQKEKNTNSAGIFRQGTFSLLMGLMLAASLLLINMTAAKLPSRITQIDISKTGLYRLSGESRETAERISQDTDIFSTVDISFAQAALGSDVKIATVDGDVMYTVKAGTQPGTRVRLRGKGVPSLRNKNIRGDHYVTLNVAVPTRMSEDAKRALREFDAVTGNSLGMTVDSTKTDGSGKGKKKNIFEKIREGLDEAFDEDK